MVFLKAHNLFDLKVEMGFSEGEYLFKFWSFLVIGQS